MSSCVERYVRGWMTDDLDMILTACADDFVYDDPIDGRFNKAEFADYFRGLGEVEIAWSEAVQEADGKETFWMWWTWKPKGAAESSLGAALVKAGPDGVHSEKVASYKH